MGKLLGHYVMPHPPIMVPEIGKGEEVKIENTLKACKKIANEIKGLKPNTIIIITPHGPMFRDAISMSNVPSIKGDFRRFGAPHVELNLNVNMQLTENIIRFAEDYNIPVAPITKNSLKDYDVLCEIDHGAAVPLYFIDKEYKDYELVHITYGILHKIDLYRLGMAIKKAVEEEEFDCVVIASGDLSHRLSNEGPYEYNKYGAEFDREILKLLREGDTLGVFSMDKDVIEGAGECGLRSFYILLGTMEGYSVKGEVLSYEGPFGVGYGVMRFETEPSDEREFLDRLKGLRRKDYDNMRQDEDEYVKLARESLEYYVRNKKYMEVPKNLSEELFKERRGVFVSIKKEGDLRGCIGTIYPTKNSIAEEIINNAIEAGIYDPRFFEIQEDELEDLVFSVDILMPPEPAEKSELDPERYGVIVRKGNRSGLLLPNLEGIIEVEEQLRIALSKAGISQDEKYEIARFEVIRHR